MEGVGSSAEGSSGSFFTPLLISMAGVVCTTLVILAYHFIVVRFFLRRSRQRQLQEAAAAAANLSSQPIGQNAFGVNEKVLSAIPILSYSTKNGEMFHDDRSECVICLGELEEGDMVRLLPNCKHVFHNSCIDKWFLAHTNCPVCRSPIAVPISSVTSLLVEEGHGHHDHHDHDDDQVRDGDREEPSVNRAPHIHDDPDRGGVGVHSNSTSMAVQLPKPDHGLLRHCVSLVLLPVEGNNHSNKQQQCSETTSLERSLSLDHSHASHVIISIQTEHDDNIDKPSSSSSSSSLSSSSSPCDSSKAVVMECGGSFKARSMRHFDRMSSVLIRSLSQLRIGQQSIGTATANTHGLLPS